MELGSSFLFLQEQIKDIIISDLSTHHHPSAGRDTTRFWGNEQGPTVFLWEGLTKRDERNSNG